MIKNYFKITSSVVLLLCSLMSFAQYSVSINDIYTLSGGDISGNTISFSYSGNTISLHLNATVLANSTPNDSYPGTIKVHFKKNSSATESLAVAGDGGQLKFLGNTTASRSFIVSLYPSDFNNTGGLLYVTYRTSSGIEYKSADYNVVKQGAPPISNNTITGTSTIYAGSVAPTITGSTPTGGDGTYTYKWENNVGGSWYVISGATSKSYSPGGLYQTTQFRRTVLSATQSSVSGIVVITVQNPNPIANNTIGISQSINEGSTVVITGSTPTGGDGANTYNYIWEKNVSGTWSLMSGEVGKNLSEQTPLDTVKYRRKIMSGFAPTSTSNEVVITVIPAPVLLNNAIFYLNGMIVGTQPTGGTGKYTYGWYLFNTDDPYTFIDTTRDLNLSDDVFNYLVTYPNGVFVRGVKSGKQTITSSPLSIPLPTPILNNTIKQTNNGRTISGTRPTGGTGGYFYTWTLLNQGATYHVFPSTGMDLNLSPSDLEYIKGYPTAVVVRSIKSGNKNSTSPAISITQPILNNTIALNGTMITGSTPTGGNGTYQYSWLLRSNEDPYFFPENGPSLNLSSYSWVFTLMANDPTAVIERIISSGGISSQSIGVRN